MAKQAKAEGAYLRRREKKMLARYKKLDASDATLRRLMVRVYRTRIAANDAIYNV